MIFCTYVKTNANTMSVFHCFYPSIQSYLLCNLSHTFLRSRRVTLFGGMKNNEEFGRNEETLREELHPMDIDEEVHFVASGLLNKSTNPHSSCDLWFNRQWFLKY